MYEDKKIIIKVNGKIREFKDMRRAMAWAIEEIKHEELRAYHEHGEGD